MQLLAKYSALIHAGRLWISNIFMGKTIFTIQMYKFLASGIMTFRHVKINSKLTGEQSLFEENHMRIPEHLRAPAIVLGLQAALLAGCTLVFLMLIPR